MLRRLGEVKSRYLGEWSDVLVAEQYRKCVVFLCADIPNAEGVLERRPVGTAFIVGYSRNGWSVLYLVTAQHVVNGSRKFGPLFVRVNMADGTVEEFQADQSIWETHRSTDVAVVRVPAGRFGEADFVAIRREWLLDDDFVKRHEMGPGDPVFFAGLFSAFPGSRRIQPIIRFGSVSLMPDEKIPVKLDPAARHTPVDAFLVEAHSRGGVSGSPAFVLCDPRERENPIDPRDDPPIRLMGLVSSHYNVVGDDDDPLLYGENLGDVELNAGLAVVIPAQAIAEVLDSPEMSKERDELLDDQVDAADAKRAPEPDSEFARFERLAGGLLGVPKEEVDEAEAQREKRTRTDPSGKASAS